MKNYTLKITLLFIIAFFSLINTQTTNAQTVTTLGFYDFESGNQGWSGSAEAYRNTNTTFAYGGSNSFWLRDNLGNNSSMVSASDSQ